ncbi:MAG: hypothetical protein CM15mP2_3020 [Methanobacteriota archaeon]|nr:MAG: hypothetical protein CM15mP2_3020 [Euryarchaeota archaeon]
MLRKALMTMIVILVCVSSTSNNYANQHLLDEQHHPMESGSAVRVQITPPTYIMSADEVVTFSAKLYDSVNSEVAGDIIWSSTNGTITAEGTFYPWNSGVITIQARHTNLTDEFNITVTPGIGQSIEVSINSGQVLQNNILTANLLDARGNPSPTDQAAWSIDGEYFGQGNPVWIPLDTGDYHLTARLYQMEATAVVTVAAGSPYQFTFDNDIIVRSGSPIQLTPTLIDANGYTMAASLAGPQLWFVENGSVNNTGFYYASHPGYWNVTVSAGPISGTGTIRVVPADATASSLAIIPNQDVYIAGEKYELAAFRTDNLGFSGLITPPITNFTVTSGTISEEDGRVYWTPMTMGSHAITVDDSGIISTVTVTVQHGLAIDTRVVMTPHKLAVGQQSTVVVQAFDLAGNLWNVNGTIEVLIGNESALSSQGDYYTLVPNAVGAYAVRGTWFDNASGVLFDSQLIEQVGFGALAKIELDGQGLKIPIDQPFDLNPRFFDSYGNQLNDISVNWTIDGEDQTLTMSLLDYNWIPTTIGSHEIQANAAGVFSVVSLTVSAGEARQILTNYDSGFIVESGVEADIFIEISDSRGNLAPAETVSTNLNSTIGEFVPSIAGRGYWTFTGNVSGEYSLTFFQDDAQHTIPLTVQPGQPVQIFGEIESRNYKQGDIALLRVYGVDINNNKVAVEPENTTISCTSGSDSFITSDTWELDISKSGLDRSCSITWNGLVTQAFFDVESVLLGGAIGSTNTAMTIAAVLLGLILTTMVVLVRRANYEPDDAEWFDDGEYEDDDYDDEDDYYEDDEEPTAEAVRNQPPAPQNIPVQVAPTTPLNNRPTLAPAEVTRLATEAGRLGVMQAIVPNQQGASGWYVDVSGEIQYWNVGADGSWNRTA